MKNDKNEMIGSAQNLNHDNLNLSLTIDIEKGYSLFKKTEKIVKGLHLATQHISDSSSLRRYIRENSIGLIECVSEFTLQSADISDVIEQKSISSKSSNPASYLVYKRSELNRRIQVTMSYVDLAVSTGYMSYKNASILSDNIISYKNEMNVFLDSIESYLQSLSVLESNSSSSALDYQKDIQSRYPQGQVTGGFNPVELELSDSFFEISEGQVPLKFDSSLDESEGFSDNVSGNMADGLKDSAPASAVAPVFKPDLTANTNALRASHSVTPHVAQNPVQQSAQNPVQHQARNITDHAEQPSKTIVQKFSGSRDDLHNFLNSMGSHGVAGQGSQAGSKSGHQQISQPSSQNAGQSAPTYIKNDRQVTIINTIKEKGELSIKDLTDVIKGCSEKTIQRELISLVSDGVLYKTGERRWSRYSLAV